MPTLLLSAGDASGDLHAADFAATFRKRNPDARLIGLGGDAMRAAGVELVADQRDLAVGGLVELFGSLGRVVRAWFRMRAALSRERPDLVVLVDSAGFNLPLARLVRRQLGAPVLYFVAPQVWAWRPGRIRKLAARVDRVAVILPFEPEVYRDSGLRVDFVGHPLLDSISLADAKRSLAESRQACGIAPEGPVVTLLPGSRRNEIAAHLRIQLEAARRLYETHPNLRFLLAVAPSLSGQAGEWLRTVCDDWIADGLPLRLWSGGSRDAIAAADVVLAKPGTATIECALLGRPLVVMGRANALTAWILRRAVRVRWLAMPNLIADEAIVPEFLQDAADPLRIAEAITSLMAGPDREAQLESLAKVRSALGPAGASERVCAIAEEMLATSGT